VITNHENIYIYIYIYIFYSETAVLSLEVISEFLFTIMHSYCWILYSVIGGLHNWPWLLTMYCLI